MANKRSWHAQLHAQAYSDFSVPELVPADRLAYCCTVAGQLLYRALLVVFWITLNCCSLAFGVFVEPLWRRRASFRRLQFPGRIPVIAVALPILLAYAAYRTAVTFGIFDVVLPFAVVVATGLVFLGALACFNVVCRASWTGRDRAPAAALRSEAVGRPALRGIHGALPEEA